MGLLEIMALLFLTALSLFLIALVFVAKRHDKQIRGFRDLFAPRKKELPLNMDEKKLTVLTDKIDQCNVIEKLWLIRILVGSSFKAGINVSSKTISIEIIGSYGFDEDEQAEDITG